MPGYPAAKNFSYDSHPGPDVQHHCHIKAGQVGLRVYKCKQTTVPSHYLRCRGSTSSFTAHFTAKRAKLSRTPVVIGYVWCWRQAISFTKLTFSINVILERFYGNIFAEICGNQRCAPIGVSCFVYPRIYLEDCVVFSTWSTYFGG